METLAFGTVLAVILFYIGSGREVSQLLPVLGIYTYGLVRLKPNLQLLYSAVAQIRFSNATLERVFRDLHHVSQLAYLPLGGAAMAFQEQVELREVRFSYAGAPGLFRGLSLKIRKGTAVGFVGPTGSGKTTAVDILSAFSDRKRARSWWMAFR